MSACLHCGAELDSSRRFYCSDAHKMRAYRRRRAGRAASAYAEGRGARRERLPLDAPLTGPELVDATRRAFGRTG